MRFVFRRSNKGQYLFIIQQAIHVIVLTHQIGALDPIGLFLPEFGSNSLQLFNKGIARMVTNDIDSSVIDQVYAGCPLALS